MKQITVGRLRTLLKEYDSTDIVYLGDDEELNGLHGAYFVQKINGKEASEISWGSITKGGVLIS